MPRLSCWYIRAALLYLAVGLTLGALMLAILGLHVWTCLHNDFQPQGRYHFAVLVPAAVLTRTWIVPAA